MPAALKVSPDGESGFQYLLKRADDPEREIALTVIAFDVPKARAKTAGATATPT